MGRRGLPSVLAALWLAVGVTALGADWLVTKDGERFEIQGSWQLKGKLAVFTMPDGTLSSIRAERIDTAASRKATDEARDAAAAPKAPPPPPAPPRRAVIVLTDKDFSKGPVAAAERDKAAGDKGSAAAASPVGDGTAANPASMKQEVPQSVAVTTWEKVAATETKADGAEIKGVLRNASQRTLIEVNLAAKLFDDAGTILGIVPATVDKQLLPPGETATFHLVASGVFVFGSVQWETHGMAIPLGQPPAAAADAAGAKGAAAKTTGSTPATASSPAAKSAPPAATPPPP